MTHYRFLAIALLSALLYAGLAFAGDLREKLPVYLVGHAALCGLMLLAWTLLRRGAGSMRWLLVGALAFRLIAVAAPPTLSDDVYRYVWDGRVQLHGVHPYAYAPADPELEALRDDDWSRINHPELGTIYPPLAQMLFLGLAASGAGPFGFKLAMGLLDFAVVLLLGGLLRRLDLRADRLVLYAWNPLAVMETAGSGHVEPLGIAMVILAAIWIIDRRPALSMLAIACGIGAKLLPAVLVPGQLRRWGPKVAMLFPLSLAGLWLPLAASGPALGQGTFAYARHWEHNAFLFPLIRLLLERDQAKLLVAGVALAWLFYLAWRRRPDPARECFLALGGVMLLSPTLHPWYVLWVLPFAAAYRSWGWLALGMLVPLAYESAGGDVAWPIRALEYLPPLALSLWLALKR